MGTPAQLPHDVIVEILLRLPAHSVARCRAVCRSWLSAISHPSFDRSYAERRPAAVAKITINLERQPTYGAFGVRLANRIVSRAVVFDLFRGCWHRDDFLTRTPSPRTLWFATSWHAYALVLGSWDGVVCLERGDLLPDHYVLWNPLTMACATVDCPDRLGGHIIGGYAHPETRRFHLLQASGGTYGSRLIFPAVFRIRRLGDAVWRELPPPSGNSSAQLCMNTHGPRFVSLHGNLHWLVKSSGSGTLQLLAFDMATEEFWSIGTPAHPNLAISKICLVSGAKLCIFAVEPSTSTMKMWVLDQYSGRRPGPGSWQLKETISLITLDRSDLSKTFCMNTELQVVEGVRQGREIFVTQHSKGRIDAYNVRQKAWRIVKVSRMTAIKNVCVVMHSDSILDDEVSFGEASVGLYHYWVGNHGQRLMFC